MDVKSLVQQWYKELAEDALEFEAQAQRVGVWDQQLRENQKALEDTVDNVHRIMSSQSDLKQACDTIEAYQAELDADLAALSENLDLELEALQLQEPTQDDFDRETSFVLAEDLNQTLNQMESNLKRVIGDLNKSRGLGENGTASGSNSGSAGSAEASNPIAKIVAVLNNHHESLAWLDEKSRQMHREIALVKKEMSYRAAY